MFPLYEVKRSGSRLFRFSEHANVEINSRLSDSRWDISGMGHCAREYRDVTSPKFRPEKEAAICEGRPLLDHLLFQHAEKSFDLIPVRDRHLLEEGKSPHIELNAGAIDIRHYAFLDQRCPDIVEADQMVKLGLFGVKRKAAICLAFVARDDNADAGDPPEYLGANGLFQDRPYIGRHDCSMQ